MTVHDFKRPDDPEHDLKLGVLFTLEALHVLNPLSNECNLFYLGTWVNHERISPVEYNAFREYFSI